MMERAVVKPWIEMTREMLQEKEREQKIKTLFEFIFGGIKPEIRWTNDKTLEAKKQIKELDGEILGRKVEGIAFYLIEDPNTEEELHWNFSTPPHPMYFCYMWTKKFKGFKAWVEIWTKKFI